MDWIAVIAVIDAVLAGALALVALLREKRTVASLSFAAIMAFNLVGDGLRDAVDPRGLTK